MVARKDHQAAIAGLIQENARRHRKSEVFRDFCELGALSISNAVDRHHFQEREARYLSIVKRYEREEVQRFCEMLAHLTLALQSGYADVMGELFMRLELGDSWKGQFFTPYAVSSMMAQMSIDSKIHEHITTAGFVTLSEPTCGAGGMVIAFAEAMQNEGIEPRECMHATAQDLDLTAVHMTYLQLSLLGIPAVVNHGNSLHVEIRSQWFTPAHVLGGWSQKLRLRDESELAASAAECVEGAISDAPIPMPVMSSRAMEPDQARCSVNAEATRDVDGEDIHIPLPVFKPQANQLSLFG
jgi:hypothetical protein